MKNQNRQGSSQNTLEAERDEYKRFQSETGVTLPHGYSTLDDYVQIGDEIFVAVTQFDADNGNTLAYMMMPDPTVPSFQINDVRALF